MSLKPSLKTLFAKSALLDTGWAENVRLDWDATGCLTNVQPDSPTLPAAKKVDILLPGMANLHCHSFQRAMAGFTETNQSPTNSFWSWRDLMYRFVRHIRPEDLQAIAAFTYMEMLQSGFTSVGEFHYLHQQPDATPYDNPAEMADQVIVGAKTAGICLSLLPVFYAHSDFGGKAPEPAQNRFVHNLDSFGQLIEQLKTQNPHIIVGIAPHSLRAVTAAQLTELLNQHPTGPVHIHIAEQIAEVRACQRHTGARPVQYLFDKIEVDDRWCLVHATHMDSDEINQLAKSKAIAGLCPITEANLGDGIFQAVAYGQAGGRFGIGSDSCILIDLPDELRTLEYSQRLRDQRRVRLAPTGKSVGGHLYRQAARGGAQALQQNGGAIKAGAPASFIALDPDLPAFIGRNKDAILDGWIFASAQSTVQQVWVNGKQVVKGSYHIDSQAITKCYADTLISLLRRSEA